MCVSYERASLVLCILPLYVRTDTEHDDAIIAKLFLFQFVNSYASLYYVAFIKNTVETCAEGSCLPSLSQQLAIIFLSQIVIEKLQKQVTLWAKNYYQQWVEARDRAATVAKVGGNKEEAEEEDSIAQQVSTVATAFD
jgi:Calcium-activated chloride channel